jgi:predicted kinase
VNTIPAEARPCLRVLLITGLPGSGKTVLATRLAQRLGVLLISKDLIKERLLDVLGAGDAAHSKLLSDASFAVLAALARQALAAGVEVILEGNFRPGEHEQLFCLSTSVRIVQVLCRVAEPTRRARLARRRQDPARHAGHGDMDPAVIAQTSAEAFLELPGQRFTFDGGEGAGAQQLEAIDRCWRGD